jgi:hypothetical protein
MTYPTLFPYGIGGFDNDQHRLTLSFKTQVKHFFHLADWRFQEHFSFLFTAFNVIQRHALLLHTSLKVKQANFANVSQRFATASAEAVHRVCECVSHGDHTTATSKEEHEVLNLMNEIQVITSHIPGSSAA